MTATKTKKTQSQKLADKNAKANRKHKQDQAKAANLHKQIAAGEKTAAEALKELAGPTETEKLAEQNAASNSVEVTTTTIQEEGKQQAKPTLAQVFPLDKPTADHQPKLVATGDPTKTVEVQDPLPPATVTKQDTKAKKAAKKTKKEQRKGNLLWVTDKAKEIVSLEYKKMDGNQHERWYVKFSDGTEEWTNFLSVVYSRENPDHHIRTSYAQAHYDKLSNKQYEKVIKEARDYAQRQANQYDKIYTAFRSSDSVQKEVEKGLSQSAAKKEPLTQQQAELALKIAQLAHKLEVSPVIFMQLPKKLEAAGRNPENYQLDRYGIDPSEATIRVLQEAVRLNRTMEPLIDGVPVSQVDKTQVDKTQATKPVKANKKQQPAEDTEEGEASPTPATKSSAKSTNKSTKSEGRRARQTEGERDEFDFVVGTTANVINTAFLKLAAKGEPVTNEMIKKETGFDSFRFQLRKLAKQGRIKKTEDGWLLAGAATSNKKDKPAKKTTKKATKKGAKK